ASTGAHVGTHAAAEAARVIFRFGLWPAALELWGIAPRDPKAKNWEKARWKDGQLVMPGLTPLPLHASAAKAHAPNGLLRPRAHRREVYAPKRWRRACPDARSKGGNGASRYRCAGRTPWHGQIYSHRSLQCEVSASKPQPQRTDLHDAVRQAGPDRDRSHNR